MKHRSPGSMSAVWVTNRLCGCLADLFSIHPLAMEDIVNVPQRPKAELYGDQQLIICRAVCLTSQSKITRRTGFVADRPQLCHHLSGRLLRPIELRYGSGFRYPIHVFGRAAPTTLPMPCWTPSLTPTIPFWKRWARTSSNWRTVSSSTLIPPC